MINTIIFDLIKKELVLQEEKFEFKIDKLSERTLFFQKQNQINH